MPDGTSWWNLRIKYEEAQKFENTVPRGLRTKVINALVKEFNDSKPLRKKLCERFEIPLDE